MIYQLTYEATKDIEGIPHHSVKNFGTVQAEHYFEALKECIELLAVNPNTGHSTEDILSDYIHNFIYSHT